MLDKPAWSECDQRNGDGKYRLQTRQVKNFLSEAKNEGDQSRMF